MDKNFIEDIDDYIEELEDAINELEEIEEEEKLQEELENLMNEDENDSDAFNLIEAFDEVVNEIDFTPIEDFSNFLEILDDDEADDLLNLELYTVLDEFDDGASGRFKI